MQPFRDIPVVVLAGGAGRRIGGHKAFIQLDGKPLIQHVLDRLNTRFAECWIVSDTKERFETLDCTQVLIDEHPGLGPIGGLATGLNQLQGKGLFMVACDMPFLNLSLIEAMLGFTKRKKLLIPFVAGRSHPLHAYYSKEILTRVVAQIETQDLKLKNLMHSDDDFCFPEELVEKVDPNGDSFFNINTQEDLKTAQDYFGYNDIK